MKRVFIVITWLFISQYSFGQNGKILSKSPVTFPDSLLKFIQSRDSSYVQRIKQINFFRITYLSDDLKVVGYLAEPNKPGKYPCIIANRGGNRDFGKWTLQSLAVQIGQMASWDYIVVASQYRGNDGGEGMEEFGGKDVNDVLNLVPLLASLPNADTSRIGMWGHSRGGMMTYLALRKTNLVKGAVVGAGSANLFATILTRPDMETNVYAELIPNYTVTKEVALSERSAVFWADQINKTTPLLIIQGSGDWRVPATESLELLQKLYATKHPLRFILYEGADHGLSEFSRERWLDTRNFFDRYVRDLKKWPNMEPHGN